MAEKISRVSSGRYFEKKPYFSAFLFPGGPVAFLLPGWPPFFRFRTFAFLSERSLSHLWVLFQRRTVPSGRPSCLAMSISFMPFRNMSLAWVIRSSALRGNHLTFLFVVLGMGKAPRGASHFVLFL